MLLGERKRSEKTRIAELTQKYNTTAFMYTEYPHKRIWSDTYKDKDYRDALLSQSEELMNSPVLLYVHMPYCEQLCWFCTCHMSITKDYTKVKSYLDLLYKEIDILEHFLHENSIPVMIGEIHLGGGSPTFIGMDDFDVLCEKLDRLTNLHELDEFAIEIDPRRVDLDRVRYYRGKGINRISFGVQDFDIDVQKAVNRIQPAQLIEDLLTPEIRGSFSNGVNFDIICGLPNQTPETIRKTAEECVRLSPDRICLNYLHFSPEFAPHQQIMADGRSGRPKSLPDFNERKILFNEALKVLLGGGYIRTGYDHFAKPCDEVALAMKEKKMHWNALGVTPGKCINVIGLGVHSHSTIGNYYFQNYYETADYEASLLKREFPIYRGHKLSQDDIIRRGIIQRLRSYFELDMREVNAQYGIDFRQYFSKEIADLRVLENDEILVLEGDMIRISEFGYQFANIVCRVFDSYYAGELFKQDLGQRAR